MQKSKTARKLLTFIVALAMVVSVFVGAAITVNAAEKAIDSGETFCPGDTVVAPAGAYFKPDAYSSVISLTGNFTVDSIEYTYGDHYSVDLSIYTGISMGTMDYPEAEEQDLVVLGIRFTGTGTESDPYMPALALGDKEAVWDGEGEGTEASPYLIKTADDLRALSNNMKNDILYNGKFFKVTADIDCGDNWEPIGAGKKFKGTFDGNGKTITYHIATDAMDAKYLGLFSRISYAGTVKHLNVAGSINAGNEYTKQMGGVAGDNFGTVTDCASSVSITTPGDYFGGVIGINRGTVTNCAASGDLTWTQEDTRRAADLGGVAGQSSNGAVLKDCTALGNISAATAGEYAGVGRVMGRNYGTEENNYYLATATAVGDYVTTGDATAKTADELLEVGEAAYNAGNPVYAKALGYIPAETVELSFDADNAEVTWEVENGDGSENPFWRMKVVSDRYYIVIKGNGSAPEGTHTWDQMDKYATYVTDNEKFTSIFFNDGSATVTIENGAVTVAGEFVGQDGKNYKITITAPVQGGQEQTPTATFTATGADTGTLSNVADGMKYKIDNGDWQTISGTSVDLTNLAPCTITVYMPGNGTTTIDSDEQTITVTKAATPTLEATQPETINDKGVIPTTTAHEKSVNGTDWEECDGVWTDLDEGTYYVRVKAADTALASDVQTITITTPVQGGQEQGGQEQSGQEQGGQDDQEQGGQEQGDQTVDTDNTAESPQTGDNSHMGLWVAIMILSLCALATMLFIGKKKRVFDR